MSPKPAHVTILLSVHDGERWLDELLRSVRAQSQPGWTLLVRDDGSTDGGMNIVREHAADDERISIVDDDEGRLGPASSFLVLLGHVDDGWFAFCDQDDVWLPDKLATGLAALEDAPPCSLVATDALVVDAEGELTAPSAFALHGFREPFTIGRLLVNNVAIGATVMGDSELARAATSVLEQGGDDVAPMMHDWWCALVAAYAGRVVVDRTPTIRWRRHPQAVTGATPATLRGRMRRRLDSVALSVAAARRLKGSALVPVDHSTARVVAAVAAIDARSPRLSQLVRARFAGARAWSLRSQAGLVVAVAARRWAVPQFLAPFWSSSLHVSFPITLHFSRNVATLTFAVGRVGAGNGNGLP